jgi:NAD+ diphosphatase
VTGVVVERFLESSLPAPDFAFARAAHDRLGLQRTDDEWLARQWSQEQPCVVVTDGSSVLLDGDRLALLIPKEAPDGERIVLGSLLDGEGPVHLAVLVDAIGPDAPGRTDTRSAAIRLVAPHAGLMVHAAGLAQWHRTHPRCARCGSPTEAADAGHVRRCPVCGASHFPRTDPAVIMLVTDGAGRALLGRQPSWPEGRFSTLAGFVEPGESLEDAVRREVMEEVGVSVGDVRYAASQAWPFPASMMVGFFARASSTDIVVDAHEIAEARWVTREELGELAAASAMRMPSRLSISRWLIETWYEDELPGSW